MKVKISTYAKQNDLTYRTIWQYVKDGKLKHETTPAGTILIVLTDEQPTETKICCHCKKRKTVDKFAKDKNSKDGFTYGCKECRNSDSRKRIKNKPGYHKERNEKYKKVKHDYYAKPENKLRQRNKELIKNFNITLEEYDEMLKKQGGTCAICDGEQNSIRNKHFAIDHCHKTGKVRGLLCDSCNRAIGLLKDSIKNLKSAINYLTKNK